MDACLSVIAQAFIDACSISDLQLGKVSLSVYLSNTRVFKVSHCRLPLRQFKFIVFRNFEVIRNYCVATMPVSYWKPLKLCQMQCSALMDVQMIIHRLLWNWRNIFFFTLLHVSGDLWMFIHGVGDNDIFSRCKGYTESKPVYHVWVFRFNRVMTLQRSKNWFTIWHSSHSIYKVIYLRLSIGLLHPLGRCTSQLENLWSVILYDIYYSCLIIF